MKCFCPLHGLMSRVCRLAIGLVVVSASVLCTAERLSAYTGYLETGMKVLVNQHAYDKAAQKLVVVQHDATLGGYDGSFTIRNDGQVIYQGTLSYRGEISSAGGSWGRYYWVGDFTNFRTPGSYTIRAEVNGTTGISYEFQIQRDALSLPLDDVREWFYHQRCGCVQDHGSFYDHCHLDDVSAFVDTDNDGVRDAGETNVNVRGGWHDASADSTKYLSSAAGRSLFALAYAFEQLKDSHRSQAFKLIDEARYQGDWARSMLDPSGGFYDRVAPSNGTQTAWGISPENQTDGVTGNSDDRRVIVGNKNPVAGYAIISGLAILAKEMVMFDPGVATQYRNAAEQAWTYYQTRPTENHVMYHAYKVLAATELYRTTGNASYYSQASACVTYLLSCIASDGNVLASPGGGVYTDFLDTGIPPATLCHFALRNPGTTEAQMIVTGLAPWAGNIKNSLANNPFAYVRQNIFGWGNFWFYHHNGNGWYSGSNPNILGSAWAVGAYARMASDPDMAAIAQHQIDWFMGLNPLNVGMVEGLGDFETDHFTTYYAGYQPNALPGYIPNGIGRPYDQQYNDDVPYFNRPTTDLDAYCFIEGWLPQNANFVLASVVLIKYYGY